MITFALPKDPQVLAAVGRVSVRHGQLDYVLRMMVKTIEQLSIREALDATERQGSRELRERVRKLAKQRLGDGEALVKLDALLTRARRATERRNELLHGLWAAEIDGRDVFRHDGHEWSEAPNAASLDGLAEELAGIAWEINVARLEGFLKLALDRRRQASA